MKKPPLQIPGDYRDLHEGRAMLRKHHLNRTVCTFTQEVRVKCGRWKLHTHKRAGLRQSGGVWKSKGVPREALCWLHRLKCLLQSRLKARLIWLRRCHWWFLREFECARAKSRSHPKELERKEKNATRPAECQCRPLALESCRECISWPRRMNFKCPLEKLSIYVMEQSSRFKTRKWF